MYMRFAVSSSTFQKQAGNTGNRKNHSPSLRIDKENSYDSRFYVKKLKRSKSVCMIIKNISAITA
jgi:hypothetical protein